MHTQIQIDSGMQNDKGICFLVKETTKRPTILPAGKMITDSEKMSFVYLLDEDEGYGQIHFQQPVWPLMADVLKGNSEPSISYNDERIQLKGFIEELTMLIFNIEGNNNYGEAFSSAVEQEFREILDSTE